MSDPILLPPLPNLRLTMPTFFSKYHSGNHFHYQYSPKLKLNTSWFDVGSLSIGNTLTGLVKKQLSQVQSHLPLITQYKFSPPIADMSMIPAINLKLSNQLLDALTTGEPPEPSPWDIGMDVPSGNTQITYVLRDIDLFSNTGVGHELSLQCVSAKFDTSSKSSFALSITLVNIGDIAKNTDLAIGQIAIDPLGKTLNVGIQAEHHDDWGHGKPDKQSSWYVNAGVNIDLSNNSLTYVGITVGGDLYHLPKNFHPFSSFQQ